MAIVAPSILSADFGHLHDEVVDVVSKGCLLYTSDAADE